MISVDATTFASSFFLNVNIQNFCTTDFCLPIGDIAWRYGPTVSSPTKNQKSSAEMESENGLISCRLGSRCWCGLSLLDLIAERDSISSSALLQVYIACKTELTRSIIPKQLQLYYMYSCCCCTICCNI